MALTDSAKDRQDCNDPLVQEIAAGVAGMHPELPTLELAARLVNAAEKHSSEPEIAVDFDGALSSDLRLSDCSLLLAELSSYGILDISICKDAAKERTARLPRTTEAQFQELLQHTEPHPQERT